MDYIKFFTKIGRRRKHGLLRQIAATLSKKPNAISLAGGYPNSDTFPFKKINVQYNNGIDTSLENNDLVSALQYGPTEGYPPFVKTWHQFQGKWHAPKYKDWKVQFCSGSIEGCSKIFELFIEENEPVMIQSPTYTGILSTLMPMLPDYIAIGTDDDGALTADIVNTCEERLKNGKPLPKLLYVNPTGANPIGLVYSNKRKEEIYKLAQKYDFLIVEDDPYYFLHFLDEYPHSFLSMDVDGRVLRLDSFSKIMSAGLRLGSITGAAPLIDKLHLHIASSTIHPSSLSQVLVHKFLESLTDDEIREHFKNIQHFYQKKRDIMLKAINKYFPGIAEWSIPKAGMFIWIKITVLDDVYDLAMNELASQNILVVPGNAFYPDSAKACPYLRLSYSQANAEEVDKALSKISDIIKTKAMKH